MHDSLTIASLLDLHHTIAAEFLSRFTYPWEALPEIAAFIRALGETLPTAEFDHPRDGVWIARSAEVSPTAFIGDTVIIGAHTEVRHGAFLRGNALVGDHAVVGNSAELKNVILFDNVQTPHYNYVGDSILGFKAHMGAGSITSNVKSDKTLVTVNDGTMRIETGLKKFGAILGDRVEVGCNSVLNPGTVIGRDSNVYPLSSVRGVVPANHIFKRAADVVAKR